MIRETRIVKLKNEKRKLEIELHTFLDLVYEKAKIAFETKKFADINEYVIFAKHYENMYNKLAVVTYELQYAKGEDTKWVN